MHVCVPPKAGLFILYFRYEEIIKEIMILLYPDPILISIFINIWDEGIEGLLIKSVNNSKLAIVANNVDEREDS